MTATLQHWPASDVPPPRQSSGAPNCAAKRDRCQNIVGIAGEHDSDGNLAVVGTVGGVERARTAVEADITAEPGAQSFGQTLGVNMGRR